MRDNTSYSIRGFHERVLFGRQKNGVLHWRGLTWRGNSERVRSAIT